MMISPDEQSAMEMIRESARGIADRTDLKRVRALRYDGPGFDLSSRAGAGHGFVNMRDRMGAFGGTIDVVSAPGTGTTIRGHVPLS